MKILGIDTSCDDTCASIIKIQNPKSKIQNFEILSNVVSSQVKLHAQYGGVYPMLAKREHIKNLPLVFRKATKNIDVSKIDFIGVTAGPGLEPCLWQGINFAHDLAKKLKKPLVPVNHIEAHILANFIDGSSTAIKFPAACLVVSGGHTQLILMKKIGNYKLVGETRDDAAGECFDKVARILELGYPGGPAVAQTAAQRIEGSPTSLNRSRTSIVLPRPMINQKNYDFSFSGLKTAVLYKYNKYKSQKAKDKTQKFIEAMCVEVQQAIIDVLIHKTLRVAKDFKVKTIILGGGVAANTELRKQFKLKIENCKLQIDFFVPEKILCTDNAAMVAVTTFFHRANRAKNIKADANLRL